MVDYKIIKIDYATWRKLKVAAVKLQITMRELADTILTDSLINMEVKDNELGD